MKGEKSAAKKRAQADSDTLRFAGKLTTAFFVIFMVMVWEHVQALRLDGRMQGLRREADRLTYENGRMSMQIHQWTSPSHLDAVARTQYGMEPLDPKHRIGLSNP